MENLASKLKIVNKVMHIFCKNSIVLEKKGSKALCCSLMTDFKTYSIKAQAYKIIKYSVIFYQGQFYVYSDALMSHMWNHSLFIKDY